MRDSRRRFLLEWMLMFLLLPPMVVWLDKKPGLANANAALYDRMLWSQHPDPANDILIIGIDKRSIDALGAWPFSRATHAQLLEELAKHSPRAVFFDVFFDLPDPEPGQDRLLAQAISKLPVYLPLNFLPRLDGSGDTAGRFAPPIAVLADQARGIGHVNAAPDADGLVRAIWRFEGPAGAPWPYLGLVIAGRANEFTPPPEHNAEGWVRHGRIGIPFAGPAGSYSTVPYVEVLRGHVPDVLLRDKILLIGVNRDSGLGDVISVASIGSPTNLAGVEVHANAIDGLLRNQHIETPANAATILWISMPIWIALVLFLRSARHAVIVAVAVSMACALLAWLAMSNLKVALPLASPLFGVVAAYLLWSWRRMNAVLEFFRHRTAALSAVPAGAFEPILPEEPQPLDSVDRRTHALDRAIDRLTRLQAILSEGVWQLPVPVLLCGADGVVQQSNAAAQALLGPEIAPAGLARSHYRADKLRSVDLTMLLARLARVEVPDLQRGPEGSIWHGALGSEFTTRQGQVFRVRAASLGASPASASAPAWVVVLPDVTAERRAQREREQWFRFLSHDIRSPQVNILSLLGLWKEGAAGVDVDRMADGIQAAAQRTIDLAENFMDVVEAASGDYQLEPCIAGAILLDAVDASWAAAAARGVTLEPRLDESEVHVLADAPLLTRAVVNLLSNAIRATEAGRQIRICACAEAATDLSDAELVIAISDEGSGMTGEQVRRLHLDNHRRGDGGTHRGSGHGWGLGMSIVRSVVARHGGWLDVISAPGEGSTFFIGIPLAAPPAIEGEPRSTQDNCEAAPTAA